MKLRKATSQVLDFGTDGMDGLPGADWITEGHKSKCTVYRKEDNTTAYELWVSKTNPLPIEDNSYTMVHAKWSLSHNYINTWPTIIGELARVTRIGGSMIIQDSWSNDPDFDQQTTRTNIEMALKKAFPEGWVVLVHMIPTDTDDDGLSEEELGFNVYAYKERDYMEDEMELVDITNED